jgi:hypothetical protein
MPLINIGLSELADDVVDAMELAEYKKRRLAGEEPDEIIGNKKKAMADYVREGVPNEKDVAKDKPIKYGTKITKGNIVTASILAGAAATGVYGGAKWLFGPRNKIKQYERELDIIRGEYKFDEGISSNDLESFIKKKHGRRIGRLEEIKSRSLQRKGVLKDETTMLTQELQEGLDAFDRTITSKSIDAATDSFNDNFPKFTEITYDNYGKLLNRVGDVLEADGVPMSSAKSREMVARLKQVLKNDGFDDIALSKLTRIEKALIRRDKSMLVDEFGKEMAEKMLLDKPMSFKEFKRQKDYIMDKAVPKTGRVEARKAYGEFLAEQSPRAAEMLDSGNRSYREFTKIRKAANKAVTPSTGKYDNASTHRWLKHYMKSSEITGYENTVKAIAEGDEIIAQIKAVEGPFQQLKRVKEVKGMITKANMDARKTARKEIRKLSDRIERVNKRLYVESSKAEKMAARTATLKSKQRAVRERHPWRTPGQKQMVGEGLETAGKAAVRNFVSKGMGRLSIAQDVVDIVLYADDPDAWREERMAGKSLPPKHSLARKVIDFTSENGKFPSGKDIKISTTEIREIIDDLGGAEAVMGGQGYEHVDDVQVMPKKFKSKIKRSGGIPPFNITADFAVEEGIMSPLEQKIIMKARQLGRLPSSWDIEITDEEVNQVLEMIGGMI